ncbi:hypothetical protein [Clostridium coskatii]|uniref:Uncharacterized protein n=1 Tax=Clostridium coskatii TaxID=1705578 RepID=A0A168PBV1_9CLOT|nr:hypothetical protein [Clostridium coskatii]OAA87549.1 hypothetical protein WX73_02731 [Clostridium coskatii]OBR96449.1 hypothetical protein CLCOS_08870 [Clostridium coskatii]
MCNLSTRAIDMLNKAKKQKVPKDDEVLFKVLKNNKYPVYDSTLRFQKLYAGISYKLGKSTEGFSLEMISAQFNPRTMDYDYYVDAEEIDGEYYFTCAMFHYNESIYMVMDSKGRIYGKEYNDNKPYLLADSIEKFIEKDAVKNYFLEKQPQWVRASFEESNLNEWKANKEYSLIQIDEACDSCSTYLKDKNEELFLTVQRYEDGTENKIIYASSVKLIKKLFRDKLKTAVGYPKYEIYRF